MRHLLTFILTILLVTSYGQHFSYPSINAKGQRIVDFIPIGWSILDSAYGDLNKDGVKDVAIILQHKDSVTLLTNEQDTVVTQPRILLILFKSPLYDSLLLKEQSNSFILKHENAIMDDPYQEIAIDRGVLKIAFHLFYNMGGWSTTNSSYKFRYDGKDFLLIGADLSTINRATLDYEDYSYNFLTKKRSYTKGNNEKVSKKTIVKPLILPTIRTLKTFTEPYSWEIESDVYL